MICCSEIITIIHRVYDSKTDMESYEITQINGASWFSKLATAITEKGIKTADVTYIRIPADNMPEGFTIHNDDWAVKGAVSSQINSQKDLNKLEYVTIVSVADNRRGHLKHIALMGKR